MRLEFGDSNLHFEIKPFLLFPLMKLQTSPSKPHAFTLIELLVVIAIIPTVMSAYLKIDPLVAQFFGGTSLLITVGVLLDTMRQMESYLLMRHYDGFLKKGKVRGRA